MCSIVVTKTWDRVMTSGGDNACITGEGYTWICSKRISNGKDSLKYGFRVHFLIVVFFFLIRFPFCISESLTYGSGKKVMEEEGWCISAGMKNYKQDMVTTTSRRKQVTIREHTQYTTPRLYSNSYRAYKWYGVYFLTYDSILHLYILKYIFLRRYLSSCFTYRVLTGMFRF